MRAGGTVLSETPYFSAREKAPLYPCLRNIVVQSLILHCGVKAPAPRAGGTVLSETPYICAGKYQLSPRVPAGRIVMKAKIHSYFSRLTPYTSAHEASGLDAFFVSQFFPRTEVRGF